MGIRFYCPNGHKLNVKAFLAGKRGICPHCGAKVDIPLESTRDSSKGEDKKEDDIRSPMAVPVSGPAGSASAVPMAAPAGKQPGGAGNAGNVPMAQPVDGNGPSSGTPSVRPAPSAAAQPVAVPMSAAPRPAPQPAPQTAAPPDPIAESPQAVWYVRPSSGGQYGPATGPIMQQWLDEGRVAADSLVWREGWPDWKTAGTVFPKFVSSGRFAGF